VKWTRLSCRSMRAIAVRLQLHALAYNLANFLRTLVLPETVERWSLTTLRERVVKIGAKVIAHARYTVFQMAEVAVSRDLFRRILHMIDALRPAPVVRC
jgi:Transposase DDE domain group 1